MLVGIIIGFISAFTLEFIFIKIVNRLSRPESYDAQTKRIDKYLKKRHDINTKKDN